MIKHLHRLTDEQKKLIIENASESKTMMDLMALVGASYSAVAHHVRKNNLPVKIVSKNGRKRQPPVDETIFFNVDNALNWLV